METRSAQDAVWVSGLVEAIGRLAESANSASARDALNDVRGDLVEWQASGAGGTPPLPAWLFTLYPELAPTDGAPSTPAGAPSRPGPAVTEVMPEPADGGPPSVREMFGRGQWVDPLAALAALRDARPLESLPTLREYLEAAGTAASPGLRTAAVALDAVERKEYPAALHAALDLVDEADAYLGAVRRAVLGEVEAWFEESLKEVKVHVDNAASGRAVRPEDQPRLAARLDVLDQAARGLAESGRALDQQIATLQELRLLLPDIPHMARLIDLRDRTEEELRKGEKAEGPPLRDLYLAILGFSHAHLPGYERLMELGEQARRREAEIRGEGSEKTSIVGEKQILERIAVLELQAGKTNTIWEVNRGRYERIPDLLNEAHAEARRYAELQAEAAQARAAPLRQRNPEHALVQLQRASNLEIVQRYLTETARDEFEDEVQKLTAAKEAWQRAHKLIVDSARAKTRAEAVRLLRAARNEYEHHSLLADRYAAALAAWARDTANLIALSVQRVERRLPTAEPEALSELRELLLRTEERTGEIGEEGLARDEVKPAVARLASARVAVDDRIRELATVEGLVGHFDEQLRIGNAEGARGVEQRLAAIALPPKIAARFDELRVKLGAQGELSKLFEEARSAFGQRRFREALTRAEALVARLPDFEPYARLRDEARRAFDVEEGDRLFVEEDYRAAAVHYGALAGSKLTAPHYVAERLAEIEASVAAEPRARQALQSAIAHAEAGHLIEAIETLREWGDRPGSLRRKAAASLNEYALAWERDVVARAQAALAGKHDADLETLGDELERGTAALEAVGGARVSLRALRRRVGCAVQVRRVRRAHRRHDAANALELCEAALGAFEAGSGDPEYEQLLGLRDELQREALLARTAGADPAAAVDAIKAAQERSPTLRRDDQLTLRLAQLLFALERWDECAGVARTIARERDDPANQLLTEVEIRHAVRAAAEAYEGAATGGAAFDGFRAVSAALAQLPRTGSGGALIDELLSDRRLRTFDALAASAEAVGRGADDPLVAAVRRFVLYRQIVQLAEMPPPLPAAPAAVRARQALPRLQQEVRISLNEFLDQQRLDMARVALDRIDARETELARAIELAEEASFHLQEARAPLVAPGGRLAEMRQGRTQLRKLREARDRLRDAAREGLASTQAGALRDAVDEVQGLEESFGLDSPALRHFKRRASELAERLGAAAGARADLERRLREGDASSEVVRARESYRQARQAAVRLQSAMDELGPLLAEMRLDAAGDDRAGGAPAGQGADASRIYVDRLFGAIAGLAELIQLADLRERNCEHVADWVVRALEPALSAVTAARRVVDELGEHPRARALQELADRAEENRRTMTLLEQRLSAFPHGNGVPHEWRQRFQAGPEHTGKPLLVTRAAEAAFDLREQMLGEVRALSAELDIAAEPVRADLARVKEMLNRLYESIRGGGPTQLLRHEIGRLDPHNRNLARIDATAGD